MTRNHKQSPSETATEPGADRFWGEFSRTGRSRDGGSGPESDREPEPEADRDEATGAGDGPSGHSAGGECLEWCPICRSAELIRTSLTPELREQAESLQREAAQVFQAFLTAYAERTGSSSAGDARDQGSSGREKPKADPAEAEEPGITEIPLD
ncbi:MAG: hypothetical protein M9938_03865 [Solirubrobacterales bacterium]|nr:hypothetical protein [Solirubrobacterales bacterium]